MIYIFVSSTFKDMQNERDYLHTAILPALNARLKEYGEEAELIDMRWGIDTSAVDEEEVFARIWKACAAEIEKSDFFLLLVGNKYGTIANIYVFADQDRLKSFTELEFIYAESLGRINKDCSLACLREIGDDFDKEVMSFREKVEGSDTLILQYAPFEKVNWEKDMGTVQNTLINTIQNLCTEQSAYTISARKVRNKARNIPKNMIDRFSEEISGKQYVVLKDRFDGANSFVAQGFLRERISDSCNVLYYDCDDDIKSWNELRAKLLQDIDAIDLIPFEENDDTSEKLSERLKEKLEHSERLYIMLEGVDKLAGEGFSKLLSKLPENVSVIITLSNSKEEYSELRVLETELRDKTAVIDDVALRTEEASAIICTQLNRLGKEIREQELERIILSRDSFRSLSYLESIMKRIELIDQYEILESDDVSDTTGFICRLIEKLPSDITELRKEFLELARKHLQECDVDRFITVLHLSMRGWRRNDIIKILGIPEFVFETLLWNLEKTVKTDRIGRISFADPNIDNDYFKHVDTKLTRDVKSKVLAYLETLPFDDPVYIEENTVLMLRNREYGKLMAFFNSRRICGPQNRAARRMYWDSFERNLLQRDASLAEKHFFSGNRFNYDSAFAQIVYENIDRFRITDRLLDTYIKVFNIGFDKYAELERNNGLVVVSDIVFPHRMLVENLCMLGSKLLDFIMNKDDNSFRESMKLDYVEMFIEHIKEFSVSAWCITHMEEGDFNKSAQKLCIMQYRIWISLKQLKIREGNRLPENHWEYGTRWDRYHYSIVDGKSAEVFKWSYRMLSQFIDELMLTLWYWEETRQWGQYIRKQIEITADDLLTATDSVDWKCEDPVDHMKNLFIIAELLEGINKQKEYELFDHILRMYEDGKEAFLRQDSFSLLLTMGFAGAAAMKLGKEYNAISIANEIRGLRAISFEQLKSTIETISKIVSDSKLNRIQAEELLYNEAQKKAATAGWIRVKRLPEMKKMLEEHDQD